MAHTGVLGSLSYFCPTCQAMGTEMNNAAKNNNWDLVCELDRRRAAHVYNMTHPESNDTITHGAVPAAVPVPAVVPAVMPPVPYVGETHSK